MNIFYAIYSCDAKLNPSEIILICWFAAQETFFITINVENSSCTASGFCGNCETLPLKLLRVTKIKLN